MEDILVYSIYFLMLVFCIYFAVLVLRSIILRLFDKNGVIHFYQILRVSEKRKANIEFYFSVIGILILPILGYLIFSRDMVYSQYLAAEGYQDYNREVFIANISLYLLMIAVFLFSILGIIEYLSKERISNKYMFLKNGIVKIKDIRAVKKTNTNLIFTIKKSYLNFLPYIYIENKDKDTFEIEIKSDKKDDIYGKLHHVIKLAEK